MGKDKLSLSQFAKLIGATIGGNPELEKRWVSAEISDLRVSGGHCYMELLEKHATTGKTIAKMHAQIWSSTFGRVKCEFQAATGQQLATGLKVLVLGTATFHEQYGLSMVIHDIDPNYTLGDMERLRKEIIEKLTKEGVIDDNRNLPLPLVPQRIAIISSKTAAGYGDFMNQLHNNSNGLKFYTCLFSATMQGDQTAPSVIAALNRINALNEEQNLFDCVVIIRGGGATTDLNSFDKEDLARNVAQFPLPVITGIGHDRDTTVLDFVAAVPVKTPTAAAEWLLARGLSVLTQVSDLSGQVTIAANNQLNGAYQQLSFYQNTVPLTAKNIVERNKLKLASFFTQIPAHVKGRIATAHTQLHALASSVKVAANQQIERDKMRLEHLASQVNLLSPRTILNRGYSLTMINGKVVTDADEVNAGDVVTTHLASGRIRTTVLSKKK